jgi:flagellar hook-associated protein 3 FlgL
MTGVYPVPTTRASDLHSQAHLLAQLHQDQLDIQRIQAEISTGRRLLAPSDDAFAAHRGMTLQRLLELKTQAKVNLNTTQSYLEASDNALGSVSQLLNEAKATALGVANLAVSEPAREVALAEIRRTIEQLVNVGNTQFRGRYLFTGSRTTDIPYELVDQQVVYRGNERELHSFVDLDLAYASNISGSEVFGSFSPGVRGTVDLNPPLTAATRLSDLRGGEGIVPTSIAISDGTTTSYIDLSSAATIGEVAGLIGANPPTGRTLTAIVSATGLVIDIDDAGGGNLTIREVIGGTTAEDLGILNTAGSGTGPTLGLDLNPSLRLTTPLSSLPGPLDLTSGLQIRQGEDTYTIDFSGAQTVEDLLNALNGSDANVLAQIDPSGDRLSIRSRLSGVDFSIGENGGTTAADLGVRSLTADTFLSQLNFGRGVSTAPGTDFTIVRKDGVVLDIDVDGAATLGDVIDLINNQPLNLAPATRVEARLAASGNGIELFDGNLAGTSTLQVQKAFASQAAIDLGLVPAGQTTATAVTSGTGDTLVGGDTGRLEVAGVFNSLLRLYDAVEASDVPGIERAVARMDEDYQRVNFGRAEIGARGRSLDALDHRLEDEDVHLQSALSDEIDTDLADAIARLTAQQAAMEATLRLTAQTFQLSLFDFL